MGVEHVPELRVAVVDRHPLELPQLGEVAVVHPPELGPGVAVDAAHRVAALLEVALEDRDPERRRPGSEIGREEQQDVLGFHGSGGLSTRRLKRRTARARAGRAGRRRRPAPPRDRSAGRAGSGRGRGRRSRAAPGSATADGGGGRIVEQVDTVVDRAGDPVLALEQQDAQVEVGGAALEDQVLGGQLLDPGGTPGRRQQLEDDLEERRAVARALRVELLDQQVERHLLV